MSLLAGLAILFASVANVHAHVHLCLDGQEPPAAMHVHEPGHLDHDAEHAGAHGEAEVHDDVDVDVPAEALAKTLKLELPALATAPEQDLRLEVAPRAEVTTGPDAGIHPSPPPYWRPPLRGPPH